MVKMRLDSGLDFILIGFGVLLVILLLVWLSLCIREFKRELKYLNNEINRTTGSEQRHWKRKKRRLLLSLIPFVKYR